MPSLRHFTQHDLPGIFKFWYVCTFLIPLIPERLPKESIQTLSLHHSAPGFFPLSELSALPNPADASYDAATLTIPLHKGASDTTYARVWKLVEKVKDTYNPDFVVVQCGLDALAGDPCATFNWSLGTGDGSLGWCINRIHKEWSGKKLYLGGG